MGLFSRLRGGGSSTEVAERRRSAISLSDFVSFFTYGGLQYPFMQTSATNEKIERPEATFMGYVGGAYKSNGVVFACMGARASVFSEARFQFRRLRNGRPGDLFGNESLAPLEEPWPNGTTGDLLSRAINDADLAGNFYAYRSRDRIYRMRPDWVTIVLGSQLDPDDPALAIDAEVIGYIYSPYGYQSGGKAMALRPEQVAHFAPKPDPEARFRGMSWLTPVIREVMGDQAATSHALQYFEKGATQNYAVVLDPQIQGDAFKEFVDLFEESHPDFVNAYRTIYLGGGANIVQVGSDMRQADFKQTRGSGETRICMAAGVPPIIIGASEGLASATYSNYAQARRAFADITMRPLWRQIAGALSTIIDVPSDAELWYDDRDISFLQDDAKDAAAILESDARSARTLTDGGYDPDSVIEAVTSRDMRRLTHSGMLPVQVQPPGSGQQPANGNGNENGGGVVPARSIEWIEIPRKKNPPIGASNE